MGGASQSRIYRSLVPLDNTLAAKPVLGVSFSIHLMHATLLFTLPVWG